MVHNKLVLVTLVSLAIVNAFSTTNYESTRSTKVSQDDKLFWGTYRPIPYIGLRSRSEDSPLIGMMWYKPTSPGSVYNIRHDSSYKDNLTKHGWNRHDGMSYGF